MQIRYEPDTSSPISRKTAPAKTQRPKSTPSRSSSRTQKNKAPCYSELESPSDGTITPEPSSIPQLCKIDEQKDSLTSSKSSETSPKVHKDETSKATEGELTSPSDGQPKSSTTTTTTTTTSPSGPNRGGDPAKADDASVLSRIQTPVYFPLQLLLFLESDEYRVYNEMKIPQIGSDRIKVTVHDTLRKFLSSQFDVMEPEGFEALQICQDFEKEFEETLPQHLLFRLEMGRFSQVYKRQSQATVGEVDSGAGGWVICRADLKGPGGNFARF